MSQPLTIVADIHAEPDKVELVKSELQKLIAPTLEEEGCLQYDLHQDNENPAHFLFFENWESRDLWQNHMSAPHIEAFGPATEGAIAKVDLYEMTKAE
jgi:quinol monooxygenase YgiN